MAKREMIIKNVSLPGALSQHETLGHLIYYKCKRPNSLNMWDYAKTDMKHRNHWNHVEQTGFHVKMLERCGQNILADCVLCRGT